VSPARFAGSSFTCAENLAVPTASDRPDTRTIFLRGFGTNALNPKVALFFLAFLPQFIGPEVAHKQLAFLLLGLLFNLNSLLVCTAWALVAAHLQRSLRSARRNWLGALDRIAGAMFVTFAVKLALTPDPNA
jgi:threonine/homoserine/homoserine lactone efflux protein